jgi:hypothetical protein
VRGFSLAAKTDLQFLCRPCAAIVQRAQLGSDTPRPQPLAPKSAAGSAKLMRELLSHVDSVFAVLLGDIGRLIKELQNRLSRAVELIGVSGGRGRGIGRKGDDSLLFVSGHW